MELSPNPPHVPGRPKSSTFGNLFQAKVGLQDQVAGERDPPAVDGIGNRHASMDHEQP